MSQDQQNHNPLYFNANHPSWTQQSSPAHLQPNHDAHPLHQILRQLQPAQLSTHTAHEPAQTFNVPVQHIPFQHLSFHSHPAQTHSQVTHQQQQHSVYFVCTLTVCHTACTQTICSTACARQSAPTHSVSHIMCTGTLVHSLCSRHSCTRR